MSLYWVTKISQTAAATTGPRTFHPTCTEYRMRNYISLRTTAALKRSHGYKVVKWCKDHWSRIELKSSDGYDQYRSLWRIRDNPNTLDVCFREFISTLFVEKNAVWIRSSKIAYAQDARGCLKNQTTNQPELGVGIAIYHTSGGTSWDPFQHKSWMALVGTLASVTKALLWKRQHGESLGPVQWQRNRHATAQVDLLAPFWLPGGWVKIQDREAQHSIDNLCTCVTWKNHSLRVCHHVTLLVFMEEIPSNLNWFRGFLGNWASPSSNSTTVNSSNSMHCDAQFSVVVWMNAILPTIFDHH